MAQKAVTLGISTFCPPPTLKTKNVAPKGGKNLDFYNLNHSIKNPNKENMSITVYPDFQFVQSQDLVCKGGVMYAFWDEGKWNMSKVALVKAIDRDTMKEVERLKTKYPEATIIPRLAVANETKIMQEFDKYTKVCEQSDVIFNSQILFSDVVPKREDYSTSQLSYTPTEGPTPAFDELMGLLYAEEELEKIMWFIGALFTNSMKDIQKFMYLYGGKGTGKGTVLKVFKMLFKGYHAPINLNNLTSGSEFATGQIKEVPLLIDDDSDMSAIKQDTYLLKLTAHEPIPINAKYRQTYDTIFNGLLITASNQRYKVRNIDSGITRRAVVVSPTNLTHESTAYVQLMSRVKYELPMIAYKAIELFKAKGPYHYETYMDIGMAEATDYIFSFIRENADRFTDPMTLYAVGEMFKVYLDELGYDTKAYKRKIKNELMRYYDQYFEHKRIDGEKFRNVFVGFRHDLVFPDRIPANTAKKVEDGLDSESSRFDEIAADYPAQLANSKGTPKVAWDKCDTVLGDIDTNELHFVRVPLNHIVIDFDLKGDDGEKDLERNLEAIKKFPPTYSELSKSGKGIHLHYYYDGDVGKLASLYEDDVEIKVFTGKQSLRRKLTRCNNLPITRITTGLPEKQKDGGQVYQDVEIISWNEKKIRTAIEGNLNKKYHAGTKPSIDFIGHILEQAEKDGIKYDVRDMRQDIFVFAMGSSNHKDYCVRQVAKFNYCTVDIVEDTPKMQQSGGQFALTDLVFYDVEVFPNLFVVCFKKFGEKKITKWINPTPAQIESLVQSPLVGFNNRRYDNHILYGRLMNKSNLELYRQSQCIINNDAENGMFSGGYELSYADIYEYNSEKMGLKKWELKLGIKHDEFELPWDQPVPEELWERVAEYCGNDVEATEEVFGATMHDYTARLMISKLSGLNVNATTTQHTAAFLFGNESRPQDKFIYTDLATIFPGYKYSFGKSEYRGEDPGEGGYVYSEPGVYTDVALLDVASMHPTSAIELDYFGPYTQRFADLKQTRIYIKHGEYDKAKKMFGGILEEFLQDPESADMLSYALKIIINIVYGMTSAKFDNKFRHKLNQDNIVAKRGALFMINLKHEVQKRGYTVAHIKTDSIKIPNADKKIIDFVFEYGKEYGYDFEHEATYERMALVNKAVYIAQYGWAEKAKKIGTWDATGAQFAEPFVFKSLFSHEKIEEIDYAITKQATAPIYLGDTFVGKVAQVYASLSGEEMFRVTEDKRAFVTGTKGHKWKLFSDYQGKDDIDMEYYNGLVEDAIKSIEKVGSSSLVIDPFEVSEDDTPGSLPF